jgi:PIN domain nuclease of toxin-antitoxin system
VILLDTNALIWLHTNQRRAAPLRKRSGGLYISPASLLELQFLAEAGRLRFGGGASPADLADDPAWLLDDPSAADWFEAAIGVGWTRDPFDRLLVAHARVRGWRLATGDTALIERLPAHERLAL